MAPPAGLETLEEQLNGFYIPLRILGDQEAIGFDSQDAMTRSQLREVPLRPAASEQLCMLHIEKFRKLSKTEREARRQIGRASLY